MIKLYNKFLTQLIIVGIVIVSSLLVWLPFLLKSSNWFGLAIPSSNFQYVLRHFDGPLYVVAAKTLYDPEAIVNLGLENMLPPIYFAAHLPLYPLLIRLVTPVFGYLKSMLFVNILFSCLLALLFYECVKRFNLTKHPLLLTTIFLFLPRFLVVRSVGAPESLFMFFILGSLFAFEKENYLLAGLFGGLASATKTPGILLFATYILVLIERFIRKRRINGGVGLLLFIPSGLLAVFFLYFQRYGDFFAYFKSGDNIHLVAPYAVFNFQKIWVGTAWLEDIVFYFFLYVLTALFLKESRYRSFFYFSVVFTLAVLFVQHRDIARYSLPLWMMFCITFERFLTSKKFIYASIILLPAIYMYAWNFMLFNIMPISNWAPFL